MLTKLIRKLSISYQTDCRPIKIYQNQTVLIFTDYETVKN